MSAGDIAKKYAPKLATFALILLLVSPRYRSSGSTRRDLGRATARFAPTSSKSRRAYRATSCRSPSATISR